MTKPISYKHCQFSPQIIVDAGWLYFQLPLSLQLIDEFLLKCGTKISCETIGFRERKFGSKPIRRLRGKPQRPTDIWHLDEVVICIAGRKHGLWRTIDQGGYILDKILQGRRSTKVAKRLLPRQMREQGCLPLRLITDKLGLMQPPAVRSYQLLATARTRIATIERRTLIYRYAGESE